MPGKRDFQWIDVSMSRDGLPRSLEPGAEARALMARLDERRRFWRDEPAASRRAEADEWDRAKERVKSARDERVAEKVEFSPDKEDALDLRWYFQQGRAPRRLTDKQRRRWKVIHRNLDGLGHLLCRYYTSAFRDPLLAVVSEADVSETFRSYSQPSQEWSGVLAPPAWTGAVPVEPMQWLRDVDGYAANGSETVEERDLLNSLRRKAVSRLNVELRAYVANGAQSHLVRREKHETLSRPAAARFVAQGKRRIVVTHGGQWSNDGSRFWLEEATPEAVVDQLIEQGELRISTWGEVRVGAFDGRRLAERWLLDIRPSQLAPLSDDEVLELIVARSRVPIEGAEAPARSNDLTFGATQENPMPDLEVECDLGRRTTTVTEIANRTGLANTHVRRLLDEHGCPARRYEKLPLSWFKSEAGMAFWEAVAGAPRAGGGDLVGRHQDAETIEELPCEDDVSSRGSEPRFPRKGRNTKKRRPAP
jgi:hypothetical protein